MTLGRKAKWTLIITGSLVLLFGLAHTPPAKELVRRLLVSAASSFVAGRVSVGALDYQLWRGAVVLDDVVLEPDLMVVPFNFSADRLEVDLSPRLTISATLERATLVFIDFFETPATDYTPVLSHIGTLGVDDGAIRFQDHNEAGELEEWIAVEGVAIDLFPSGDDHRAALHTREGHAYNVTFGAIDADLFLRPGHLRAASASVFKDDSFVRVSGELDFSDDLQGQFDSDFALDGALARLLDEELHVIGLVAGRTRIDVVDGTSTVESELTSDSLAWEGVLAEDVEAEAVYEGGTLTLRRLEARGFGGRARLGAKIAFDEGARNRFELSWNSIDAAGVVAAVADESLPFAARIGGNASLTLTGSSLDSAAGNARVELEPGSDIVGSIDAALDSEVVSVRTQNVFVPELETSLGVDGTVTTHGELDLDVEATVANVAAVYEQAPLPIEGSLSLRGRVSGSIEEPRVEAALASDGLRMDDGDYQLTGSVIGSGTELILEDVGLGGELGSILANGSVPLSEGGSWRVAASIEGVAEGAVSIFGPAGDPDWSTEVVITPTMGRYSVVAGKSGRTLHIDELTGALAEATLNGRGSYDLDSESVDASFALQKFRPSELASTAKYLYGFDALVGVDATVAGSWSAPATEAAMRIDELTYDGTPLPPMSLSFVGNDGALRIEADRSGGSRLLTGTLELSGNYPLHTEIDVGSLPISEMLRTLPIFLDRERAVWTVDGTAVIDVPLTESSELAFRADIDSVEARFTDASARASRFTIDGTAESVRIEGFELRGVDNNIKINGVVPLSADTMFDLNAEGRLDLGFVKIFEPELEIEGLAVLAGTLTGSLEAPDVDGTLRIDNSSGSWAGVDWSDLSLSATAEEDRLSEIVLDANVLGGRVELDGRLPFVEQAGAGRLEFKIIDVDVMPNTADGTVVVGLSGAIDLPSAEIASWSGAGTLDRVSARAADSAVDLARTVPWKLVGGSLAMPDVQFEGRHGQLAISIVSMTLNDFSDISIDATASGLVDIAFANAFIESPGTRIDGRLELDAAVRRVDSDLAISGQATLTDGRLSLVDPGFVLSNVVATLVFDDETITISELSARTGSGTMTGQGSVDLSEPSRPVFDLEATANAVPLQVMDGLRAEVSGQVRVESTAEEPRLSANFTLDRGLLTRELEGDDNNFSAQSVVLSDPTAEPGPIDQMTLNIVIATARNVRVENSTMQLEAAGNISIAGTIAAPEVGGFVSVLPDGTFNIGRNKFQVLQGRIDLTGFPLVSPNITLLALTRVGSTTVNVDLQGDMDDMRTRLTAPESPELTEGDLASLLVTGRTLENAGEGGQQMASTWMMSSLANLVHDGLGDLFSFGPAPGAGPLILAEEADPTSRLTLGFPVTDRLSVTYSIALDSTERRLWILDYRVARNVWIRATQENSNDYGFGLSQRFNVDFRSRAAERTATREQRIGRIEIEGDQRTSGDLVARLEIRDGGRYDYWIARDAALKLEESLVKEGFRSAVVEVETDVDAGTTRDHVSLRFVVAAGALTEFEWRGDDPPKDAKKRLEQDWDGRIPEEFVLTDVTRRTNAELRAERYYSANVEASIESFEERRVIVFDVVRGPRGEKTQLTFSGNFALSNDELVAALPNADTPEFFLLLDRRAELERGIRLRYAASGYLDVTVGTPATSYEPDTKTYRIEIPVVEGPRTEILSVSFDGELALDSEKLSRELGVVPETPVDFPEIRRGQTRLRTLYRNEGFPDVKVLARLERVAAGLDVRVLIDEGARARVGEVRVVGNRRTDPKVILDQLTFAASQSIRIIDFQDTQRRLYDLGIFRSADVRTDPTQQGQKVQDVIIQVVERADLDVNYGLRYNVVGSEQSVSTETEPRSTGLEVVSRVNFVNQFGRGTNFGVSVFFQPKFQLYRVTFRVPTFLGHRIVTELFANTERDEERFGLENFETRSDAVTFQQTKKLTDSRREKFALQWNVRFGRFRAKRFDEIGVLRDIDTNRLRFGVSLIEDRRDSFANPTRGRFWNITLQAVPEILGSDVAYLRLYGQFFYTYPVAKWLVWSSGIRMGFAKGTKELLLMEDRFQAGGANSVRGFKQNTLGPSVIIGQAQDAQERLYVGGQAVSVFNQELRFPIYKAFHGGVYWDAGNVFAFANQFRLSDLRQSLGAGLRFVLPFGAIRFDWAKALNPQPQDETTRFHFSFGYAF